MTTHLKCPTKTIRSRFLNLSAFALILYSGSALARDYSTQVQSEASTGVSARKLVKAKNFMVVAANPYASRAGYRILEKGGSAVDAAVAVQMVLNLVEPQSSGIGGGAFLLHWNRKSKNLLTYDGRETAPQGATSRQFLLENGKQMPFGRASFGGLSVGVPGLIKVLELAHKNHGKLSWKDLFLPAIELAEKGFKASPRLHKLLKGAGAKAFGPDARKYFFSTSGNALPIGHVLKNPLFGETLRVIAGGGSDAFYKGDVARDIVNKVRNSPGLKGNLSLQDLASYRAKTRPAVCTDYRSHKVCGMGPPSSGALTVAQVLKLVEAFDLGRKPMAASALHVIVEAQKLAYADRRKYIADPDYVTVPGGLLEPRYIANRRQLIDPAKSMGMAKAGTPPDTKKTDYGLDHTLENSGTSHVSIIDRDGNAVALTTTIESGFGSNIMVRGFLLNNELTDFSFLPEDKEGIAIANRVGPGKRPRSSMAPTFVFDDQGSLELITGSPGGSSIILYVLKALIAHIDWGLDPQSAAALPNFGSRNGPIVYEAGSLAKSTIRTLDSLGHQTRTRNMTSGLHTIFVSRHGLYGGVDPRREGLALGN